MLENIRGYAFSRRWGQYRAGFSQGFSLVEMLVAMMVILIFVSITMQIFVSAAFFRVRAEQVNDAYTWIQEDYETLLDLSKLYENSTSVPSTRCNATSPALGLAAGFIIDNALGTPGSMAAISQKYLGGKEFALWRNLNYQTSSNPFKTVKVDYEVRPLAGGQPLTEVKTELILEAVFNCSIQ